MSYPHTSTECDAISPQCDVTVGYDADVRAASWSCRCGASGLVPHARPGMGELVARRLAGLYAERHLNGEAS